VSSEQNVGTEFVFTIPLDDTYLSNGQKVESNNFNSQNYFNDYKMQIFDEEIIQSEAEDETKQLLLIVDDNQEILLVLNEHFKKEYNILLASDGEEALAVCNVKMPDLIISDVMMPKMDGLELCSRVKSQISTCFIPLVLLTARDTVEQQIEGIDEGADAYIPKPFNLALLQSTVKNLLKRRERMLQILRSSDEGSIITETKEDGEARLKYVDQKNQQFVEKLRSIIELNLENINYSIDDLCLAMGVSRTRLYVKMKSVTKDTLGDYIREIRMQKTTELLMTTDLPIYEVAARVGFTNVTHFNRSFKERFGLSPTEYVKRAMQSDNL
jgi:DNA-binding response OmpR family regulator